MPHAANCIGTRVARSYATAIARPFTRSDSLEEKSEAKDFAGFSASPE